MKMGLSNLTKTFTVQLTLLESSVIKVLLYFDIFHYPLRSDEVFKFLSLNDVTKQNVEEVLQRLSDQGIIHAQNEFFSLHPGNHDVLRRQKGNTRANELMPLAYKRAALIAKFPFVRAVMASGSISKQYMDEKSDIDFFIVTSPNRLFIARTLLVLFKRIFLFNSHKSFCVNYFIGETHLNIAEKNLFTATELATVLPLYNPDIYLALIEANPWLREYFPNFKLRETDKALQYKRPFFTKLVEYCLNLVAVPAERLFLALTLRRWKRIYARNYSADEFAVAFKTNPHTSKNHPRSFQQKVIEVYDQKITDFNSKYKLTLL